MHNVVLYWKQVLLEKKKELKLYKCNTKINAFGLIAIVDEHFVIENIIDMQALYQIY
jgi:hypothetical protein